MKRKVIGALLILIVAIMCCGCAIENPTQTTYSQNKNYAQYEEYDEYEFDITYKKDKNDHSPVVYITKTGKRYHTSNCHYSQNAYKKLTIKQAWDRDYTPCYFCCY